MLFTESKVSIVKELFVGPMLPMLGASQASEAFGFCFLFFHAFLGRSCIRGINPMFSSLVLVQG